MRLKSYLVLGILIPTLVFGAGETSSPNMNLVIPAVGVTTGPQWASDINTTLGLIDSHDHSPGKGVQITPAGINISSDLSCNSNSLTNVKSERFSPQNSALGGASDIGELYNVSGDLFYNDGSGNQIRITQSGSVTGSSGTITGLPSGTASAAFISASGTFQFLQSTGNGANMDAGSLVIRYPGSYPAPSGNFIAIEAPTSLATGFAYTLPNNTPITSNALLTSDTGGSLSYTNSDSSTISIASGVISVPTGGITATQIANTTITLAKLAAEVSNTLVPPGSILPFGGTSAPTGFLLCDGSSVLRATYPNLFSAIGTAYGTADGTHFNVPDLRGRFLRGVDGGTARDPNAGARTAMNAGGNTGNNVGSIQADAFKSHNHAFNALAGNGNGSNNDFLAGGTATLNQGSTQNLSINSSVAVTGGSETRPLNAYVNYIIKQ